MLRKNKLQLSQITLIAVTSVRIEATIKAMKYSMRKIEFGDCIFISHEKPDKLPQNIRYEHIPQLRNIDDFNHAMIYDIAKYIKTEFVLLVHYDGFVVNPNMWRAEFLDYDYIGSPWPYPTDEYSYRDKVGNICRVGNSVSIRSKKLLEFPSKVNLPWELEGERDEYNEDTFFCCKHKNLLEENGMRFAPIEIAKYFGHERPIPEVEGIKPFLFHKWKGDNWRYPMFHQSVKERVRFKIQNQFSKK